MKRIKYLIAALALLFTGCSGFVNKALDENDLVSGSIVAEQIKGTVAVKIEWEKISGNSKYVLFVYSPEDETYYTTLEETSYVLEIPYPGKWEFKVKGYSTEEETRIVGVNFKLPERTLNAAVKTSCILLQWEPVEYCSEYRIYCRKKNASSWDYYKTTETSLSYVPEALGSYEFYLANGDGYSFSKTITVDFTEQSKIENLSVAQNDSYAVLSWDKQDGYTGYYYIYTSTDGENFTYTSNNCTKDSSISISLTSTSKVYYRVQTAYGLAASDTVSLEPEVQKIEGLTVVRRNTNYAGLSWEGIENYSGYYYIYTSTDGENFTYDSGNNTKDSAYSIYLFSTDKVYYRVQTAYGLAVSDTVSFEPEVTKIENLTVVQNGDYADLSWTAVDGYTGYYYIYKSTYGESYTNTYYSTTKTSNSIPLSSTEKVYYKVETESRFTYSDAIALEPEIKKIKNFTVVQNNDYADLSWTAVDGFSDSYIIYTSTDGENFKYKSSTDETTKSIQLSGTDKVYYKVQSAYGFVLSDVASLEPEIKKIEGITVVQDGDYARLSWTAADNFSGSYYIYKSTDGENFSQYSSTSNTFYSVILSGTDKAYYKVQSAYGFVLSDVVSLEPEIKKIEGFTVVQNGDYAKLSWTAADNFSGSYYIYKSTDGENFSEYSSTSNTFYFVILSGTDKVYYKVQSAYGFVLSDVVSLEPEIKKIEGFTVVQNGDYAKLSWTAVEGFSDTYYIYKSTDGENFTYKTFTNETTESIQLSSTDKVYYKIKSYYGFVLSDIVSLEPEVKKIKGLTVVQNGDKAALSWTAVDGFSSYYYIYKSTDGENFSKYSSTSDTSFSISLSSTDKVYYKVQSEYGFLASDIVSLEPEIQKIEGLTVTQSGARVDLFWDAFSDYSGNYYIYTSTDGENFTSSNWTSGTSYSKALSGDAKLYYRIQTKTGLAVSSAVKLEPDYKIKDFEVTKNGDTGVTLSWTKVSNYSDAYSICWSTDGTNYTTLASTEDGSYEITKSSETGLYYYKVVSSDGIFTSDVLTFNYSE